MDTAAVDEGSIAYGKRGERARVVYASRSSPPRKSLASCCERLAKRLWRRKEAEPSIPAPSGCVVGWIEHTRERAAGSTRGVPLVEDVYVKKP